MANWFIALPIAAGAWFDALEPPAGVRKFAPSDLHLTVAFLGPVPAEAARRAFALAQAIPLEPVSVTLGPLEALGGRAAAFSALLLEQRSQVEHAIGSVRGALFASAGARPDTRPPLAHVTVARLRRGASLHERQAALDWAHTVELSAPPLAIERIALYTWSSDRKQTLFAIDRAHALAEPVR